MSDPTLHREEELFDAARQLTDPVKRQGFLDFACAEDPEMRKRIKDLLAAHVDSEIFFGRGESVDAQALTSDGAPPESSESTGPFPGSEEAIGSHIGRYKLVEKIGEGGCGVVYLAEQVKPVSRRVALKIIRFGMETKSVVSRFEAERQTLAMMDHPNIARVFDAGETRDGSPYFVMEYVQGERITRYCDEHRLSLRQRLDLFIQISHAIQHAHQKGIVHGDIKPSNIMVALLDGMPVPKVIDFGISKVTDARLTENVPFIAYAQLIGTPAYMSPEQVEMSVDVDTRSDIYSLGILLYELLTGKTPYEASAMTMAGAEEMRRTLRERLPVQPTEKLETLKEKELRAIATARDLAPPRLISRIRGDLDAIVMKALEKDRRKRYETANGLALEIQRHLNHEPITACDPGWVYRFQKLVRRNRGVFLAVGAVAAALVVGTVVSTRLYFKEREARSRAVAAELEQVELRRQAEVREQVTQAALWVSQERHEDADTLLRAIVSPPPTLETAAVFRSVGEWHAMHGRWSEAADRFAALVEVNVADGPDVSTLDYLELGPALIEAGDLDAYERFRRDAIARFGGSRPFGDRIMKVSLLAPADDAWIDSLLPFYETTKSALANADAADDAFQAAWQSVSLALFEYRRGELEAAADWVRRCLAYADANAPRTAMAKAVLAMALHRLGLADEAQAELKEGFALMKSHAVALAERGSPVAGFWFDWAFARILLSEARQGIEAPG